MTRHKPRPTGHYRAEALDKLNRLIKQRDALRAENAPKWRLNLIGREIANKELQLARYDGKQLGYEGRNEF